jgi:hypothetical protein
MGHRAALFAVLAALLALAGPVAGAHSETDTEAGFDNVQVMDASLDGRVSVTRVGSDRTNTNLLSIFADLKNLTGHVLTIEAQTLYKDSDGNWIDGGHAGWVRLELKPHEEFEYRSASLSEAAEDFLVRVRLGK